MKFIKSETFFILFFSFLILALSFSQNIYELKRGQHLGDTRRVLLALEHNFTYDYNVYLSKMRQGAEGAWTIVDKYTTEPNKGVFLQEFYLLAGKAGALLNLEPPETYFLLRLGLAIVYVLAIYALILFFVKNSMVRRIAFVLALFSGGWPKFLFYEESWHAAVRFDWWQEMDQIKRASYVPHYLLGHIMTIAALLFLLKSKNRRSYFVLAVLAGAVAGFVHPPSLLIVWGIWGLWTAAQILVWRTEDGKQKTGNGRQKTESFRLSVVPAAVVRGPFSVLRFFVFIFLTSLPLLYVNHVTGVYPWKSLVDYDLAHPWIYSLTEYLLALGITLPLGILGLFSIKAWKKEEYWPLLFWIISVPVGMLLLKITGLHSELYFIQVAVNLPLAVFSAIFIVFATDWLKKKTKYNLVSLISFLVLLFSVPGIYASLYGQFQFIDQRAGATMPLVPYPSQVMYPLKDWWNGIMWLKENTSRDDIVLTEHTAGNYIPAYAGNIVYLGHVSETPGFVQKRANADYFFRGGMSSDSAKSFLTANRIKYVFFDPQAAEQGDFSAKTYPFLKSVYSSPYASIYEVTK